MDIKDLTIKTFHEGLVGKKFSATEVAEGFFGVIGEKDNDIHAYLRLTKERALSEAKRVDQDIADGREVGVLAGVPCAIKDNMLVKGEVATAGSKILEGYRASYDATVVSKLKGAHAAFLGATNMDEFGMGSSTENSAFGPTKNPHDLTRVPGGTSGGSAAAVASGMAVVALGTDTGGSVRQPASFCGVVGLRPTYGAVSRSGVVALASSLDQIGPITKTVHDAAILFDAIRGEDDCDATSARRAYDDDITTVDTDEIKKLTIGLPKEYFIDGVDSYVRREVDTAIARLKKLGFKFKEVSLPHTEYALSSYYIILPAEASTNLARFDGIRYARIDNASDMRMHANTSVLEEIYFQQKGLGFGAEPRRRVLLGTFVLSHGYYDAYYARAQKVRQLVRDDFEKVFDEVDVLLTPVAPTPAFKLGEYTSDPLQMYLGDVFTIPTSLAGLPGISVPVCDYPLDGDDLPVGFQLIGKRFRERDILGVGRVYEESFV